MSTRPRSDNSDRQVQSAITYSDRFQLPVLPCQPQGKKPLTSHGSKTRRPTCNRSDTGGARCRKPTSVFLRAIAPASTHCTSTIATAARTPLPNWKGRMDLPPTRTTMTGGGSEVEADAWVTQITRALTGSHDGDQASIPCLSAQAYIKYALISG